MVSDLVVVQLLKHKVGVAGDPLVRQMDYSAGKPRRCVGFGKGVDDMEVALSRAVDEDDALQEELREAKAFAPVFANQAAANGFAFNFKVTVSRGPSGQGGHISKIGGAFQ